MSYLRLLAIFATFFSTGIATNSAELGAGQIVLYGILTIALMFWPIQIIVFILRNHEHLEEPDFKQKYGSYYQGIRTNSFSSLLYEAVFAVRRFDIIVINLLFTVNSPISGLKRNMYLEKILMFHCL